MPELSVDLGEQSNPELMSTAPSYELSGWWLRAAALLMDGILLYMVLGAFFSLILATLGFSFGFQYILTSITALVYFFALLTRKGAHNGQTLGKQAAGIRVVRNDGQPVDATTVLVREVLFKWFLGTITLGLFLLFDYLWPLGDSENRAIHDHGAKTHVIIAK